MPHDKNKGAIPKGTKPTPARGKMQRTPPQKSRPSLLRTSLSQAATNFNESIYQCIICKKTDSINKVCCDGCNFWSHFACAGVTSEMLAQDQWLCQSCQSKGQTTPVTVSSNIKESSKSNVAVTSKSSAIPIEINVSDSTSGTNASRTTTMLMPIVGAQTSNPVNPTQDPSVQSEQAKAHSQQSSKSNKSKSVKSNASSSKLKNLAIQRLEEEQRMIREREKEEQQIRREQEKEDRKRRERQEKEYLDKKYSILACESSEDSATDEDYEETSNRDRMDPERRVNIGQWLSQAGPKNIRDNVETLHDSWYNLPANDAPQLSSTNVVHRKQTPILTNDNAEKTDANTPSTPSVPVQKDLQINNTIPQPMLSSSSANLPMPSTVTQSVVQSSTTDPNVVPHLFVNSSQSKTQGQSFTSVVHSAAAVNQLAASNNQSMIRQQATSSHYINPISDMPSTGYYITEPNSSTINSTFVVNSSSAAVYGFQNQPYPTFAQMLPTQSQPPIMSSMQQTSSQNHSTARSQPFYQTQPMSNTVSLVGYQNPVSAQLNHRQIPASTQFTYQPIYSTQQGPLVSSPYQIGSYGNQPNIGHYSTIPPSSGMQSNLSSNSTLHGQGVNVSATSNTFMLNDNISRRLTSEQIVARQIAKELPHFYGDAEEWQVFYSAYNNANALCGYNNHENLERLIRCLKGEAREAVKSLLTQPDSVPDIIRTLFLIYGRPEVVIESMIQEIQKEPAPKDDDLSSVMRFAIKVRNLSRTIRNTGAVEHMQNPLLITSITNKLPAQLLLQWACYKSTVGVTDISTLGEWCNNIAEAASLVVRPKIRSNYQKKNQREYNGPQKDSNSSKPSSNTNNYVNAHVENASKDNSSPVKKAGKCPACKNESCTRLSNCKKFKDLNRNERLSVVKENKLCTRCLGNHHFYRCRSNFKCKIDSCGAKHHNMLHDREKSTDSPSKNDNKSKPQKDDNGIKNSVDKFSSNASHSKAASSHQQRVDKFRIVPIIVSYKGRSVNDFAYLDDGSNMTSMEKSLAKELQANGTSSPICVDWAFGQRHTFDSKIVSVKLSGSYDGAEQFNLSNVRTVNELHLPTQSITSSWLKQFDHLNGIPISTYESIKPRMLIGLQYSRLMVSLKTVEGKPDEPVACKTRLGWVIQGPSYKDDMEQSKQRYSMNMCECQVDDSNLHQLVKNYFHSENLDVKIPTAILESKENQRAKSIMEATTSKVDGRYETGLLWKHDKFELPNSYPMALKRLQCLEAKMSKDPKLAENLRNQIRQFVDKKYIRKLTPEELQTTNDDRVWYLPTFPAFNPKKPEKVRIVWDGAAKVMNISLNSLLLTGPDQLVPLPDILRKFRERMYAILGDIKEMYHQIKVIKADQNVQRFLWRDGDQSREPDVYIMMVVTFGLTCSPSQAQYIKNRNALEFIKEYPEAVDTIINKHYVDDLLDCEHTIDAAERRIQEVKFIHMKGGFEIRNFLSNSKELLNRIGEKHEQSDKNMNVNIELGTERVLGMFWNAKTDCFTYSLKYTKINEQFLFGEHHPTKREVLRTLMSVFDPLGLLANYLIHIKILIQEIWRTKVDWDEKINPPHLKKWSEWIKTLPEVENISIPRLYSPKLSPIAPKSIQMHTFVDASHEAYATAVYLRFEDDEGVDCCLVGAKTKVAPNKPMTIPRLELQGAVLGTRLANSVKTSQTFKIDKYIYWTDNLTVMGWINSEARKYNQFVAFRIGEILESTESSQWRWVPSEHNVADEATKSAEITKLDSSSRWYKAPEFLYDDEKTWFNDDIEYETEEEIRPAFAMAHREIARDELIDLTRFSQWNRLLRTQAYVFRFIYNVRQQRSDRRIGPLKQEEMKVAENHLYRRAQMDHFIDEILIMRHNQRCSLDNYKQFDCTSNLRTYSPYLDENDVIRMKGRIDAAKAVTFETKRPIILPRRHHITHLIVDYYHRRYKHANHSSAINEIRQKFAIPALRVVMKGIRTSCQRCKNLRVEPQIPEMAELPPGRLATYMLPFTFVGVDYFGPIRVRNGRRTRNRPVIMEKRWILIFTCLTTRAIWMEIAHSMDTNSCIMCIDNFILRKGRPREVYSDNGLSFHSSDKELSDEFANVDQKFIEEKFTTSEMQWKFNPPATPHMGGVWERLIRTVKTCLKETMKSRTPNDEMLKNLIVEAEYIVNSRPLTYVSLETADDEALTPNHILLGSSNGIKPLHNINERDLARNTYKAVQVLANHFWHRFVLEYLPTLTRRTKWFKPAKPIQVGDVAVVVDEKSERNSWPKAIVVELLPGKSGIVRQVMVKTAKGIRKRSVSKLAVLDVKPPSNDLVNRSPTGSINGEGNVEQRRLNVSNDIISNQRK